MNELQLGLIGTGVVILLGVVAYNAWQSSKVKRRIPRSMKGGSQGMVPASAAEHEDERPFIEPSQPAVGRHHPASTERREPTLARTAADAPHAPSTDGAPPEPDVAQTPVPVVGESPVAIDDAAVAPDEGARQAREPSEPSAEAGTRKPVSPTNNAAIAPAVVDERIDCVVNLPLGGTINAERVLPLAQRMRRAGGKAVHVEGWVEDPPHWELLRSGGRYTQLRMAVQLANRAGPLNEVEFSEFISQVQALADAVDALPELPDMMETVGKARDLDSFAAQCDAQLSVNVLSDGAPWSANYIQAVATQDGLLLSRDGTRFVKLDTRQNPVFTLQFGDTNFLRDDLTYKGGDLITLLLDVPVADEDLLPFRLMCDYAKSIGQRIGGRVVDDQRRLLPETALTGIETQLMSLYARLEQRGLPAGALSTRRLFGQ
ncbi:cell division protein ZipA C-terminal FtsZ-binding domain-containing protein [Pandoraea sp.]|uniref:cell division protein ZipA C-terminal FtsZ-binding domain-containing protein n=1 Tax=Pandoraea sp. TaxID=1883445 RepID=UPI0011FBD274|nr:cell division protein ZipA C-terminal FtsZ-binding domain-containing protein [Pandoraea sp.]TAL52404.1 MAG: cell division protein FtsZ [Pandoraea sp.]TAM16214.1 MAG: cell division protein FtsZ [Pandoraea sp.]